MVPFSKSNCSHVRRRGSRGCSNVLGLGWEAKKPKLKNRKVGMGAQRFFVVACMAIVWMVAESVGSDTMPLPFTRELYLTDPPLSGSDVFIACNLLARDDAVSMSANKCDYEFDSSDADATREFQDANGLSSSSEGVVDGETANALLELHSADRYKDSGFTAASMGYKYKFHIPVHMNRSMETEATLFDAENRVLMSFKVRAHGLRDEATDDGWPDFGDGDYGLNEFTSSGNTPTGLVEVDLNSPEPDPDMYGPWPVNRVVRGVDGNAAILLPNIRDGILIHTGNWTTDEYGVITPADSMPNSHGCLHAHPNAVERIQSILIDLGVTVNDNTYSGKNYPYQPQGIAVIELIDQ